MFADANMQYVVQNGVLPDVMTPPGILLENARFQFKTLQQDFGFDLDKMLVIGFALK